MKRLPVGFPTARNGGASTECRPSTLCRALQLAAQASGSEKRLCVFQSLRDLDLA
jgi:hypothetical protein